MPNFKKSKNKFSMKGFSPFTKGSPYTATIAKEKTFTSTQDKPVPPTPKKPKEEAPHDKKKRLEKEGKTNTKEYKDLIKMFEGPGGYGDEQWDKE